MTHALAWPVELAKQDDGSILVSFADIPEALTEGATEEEAMVEAQDCLVAALGGYVDAGRVIPRPSPARGRATVALPALVAAKVALYDAMRYQGVEETELAMRLGVSATKVARLVNLDCRSRIGQVEAALGALGQRLMVSTQAA